jgi:hypothetical protein
MNDKTTIFIYGFLLLLRRLVQWTASERLSLTDFLDRFLPSIKPSWLKMRDMHMDTIAVKTSLSVLETSHLPFPVRSETLFILKCVS